MRNFGAYSDIERDHLTLFSFRAKALNAYARQATSVVIARKKSISVKA